MAQLLRRASGPDRSPAPRAFAPSSSSQLRGAKLAPTDQDLARATWVNLFVVGADDEVAKLITSLLPCLATPIAVRERGQLLPLSPTSPPVGTIIIYDVDTLTRLEQHALKRWLTIENPGVRVVSSASSSLWPMVQSGAFNDDLYYRLNAMTIDLTLPVAR